MLCNLDILIIDYFIDKQILSVIKIIFLSIPVFLKLTSKRRILSLPDFTSISIYLNKICNKSFMTRIVRRPHKKKIEPVRFQPFR